MINLIINSVALIFICLGISFCVGVVCGILSIILVKKHKHPIVSILLSIISWFGLCIPIDFTVGYIFGISAVIVFGVLFGIFVISLIIANIKNMIGT